MASQAVSVPLQELSQTTLPPPPTVLVVDADGKCADHCGRMLDDLNYQNKCVTSPREALELVAQDTSIQIVVANTHMPSVDGFVLIEEARARVGKGRPLAVIVMADQITTDLAMRSLHVEAVDFLTKPLGFEDYSKALRRASRYLEDRHALSGSTNPVDFQQQIARLLSALENKAADQTGVTDLTDQEIGATLRSIIGSRGLRNRFFPSQIFADPAWDILLDLTRAKLDGQQVSVSSVCIAASVPMSTALRWVKQMTDAGLLKRWTDPKDRRRDLITLTDKTSAHMRDYLTAVYTLRKKN